MINAFLIQLHIPRNFLGVLYREVDDAPDAERGSQMWKHQQAREGES